MDTKKHKMDKEIKSTKDDLVIQNKIENQSQDDYLNDDDDLEDENLIDDAIIHNIDYSKENNKATE